MSGETPLIGSIEGYSIVLYKTDEVGQTASVVIRADLRLSKIGGAHIKNPEDLIMLIEDAVFREESR